MNEKHKIAVERSLAKARTNLELAGKQATSRAESTLVEALHWLHIATDSMKAAYEEKITQLEAELQVAKGEVTEPNLGSIENLKVQVKDISVKETTEVKEPVTLEVVTPGVPFPLEELVASSPEEAQEVFAKEMKKLDTESNESEEFIAVEEKIEQPVSEPEIIVKKQIKKKAV